MNVLEKSSSKQSQLKPNYFLGLAIDVKNNVHFIDDETLLYPIGRVFLYHNLETQVQRYIKIPKSNGVITSISISPNRKLVAVIHQGNTSTISVFNLETRRRVIYLGNPLTNCESKTFEFVSFTCDNEYIVAVTGAPDWMMIYYKMNGHVESYTSAIGDPAPASALEITQIACNPSDRTILCIAGIGLFRFISWTDDQWIQYGFNAAEKLQITVVCWVTDEIVIAGTKCGRLIAIEYGDVRGVFRAHSVVEITLTRGNEGRVNMDSKDVVRGHRSSVYCLTAIVSFGSGFAYSYTKKSVVVFMKTGPLTWVRKNVVYTVEPSKLHTTIKVTDVVQSLAVSPSGLKLACTTDRKEVYYCDILTEQHLAKDELRLFDRVLSGFHAGRVVAIAACRWKTLMMSLGKDEGCCRIWNYQTKKLLFTQYFPDEKMYSCAFSPTGWFCLIGFKHQLKMFMVMVDELKPIWLFRIKICSLVKFSRQEHLFAASNPTQRTIEVYCCVSFENLWVFKCYDDPITAISFDFKDNYLYTADPNGSINCWDLQTGEDMNTTIYMDGPNYSVTASKKGDVFFVGADGTLKQIENGQLRSYKICPEVLYAITLGDNEECLYAGGDNCSVISLHFLPSDTLVFNESSMHSWSIKQLIVTNNDSTLISLDEQGVIGFWRIHPPSDKPMRKTLTVPNLSEVVVNIKKLAEEDEIIAKQQVNIERKLYQHNYIVEHLQDVNEKALRSLTDSFAKQIDGLKMRMTIEEKFHSTETSKYQQRYEELERYYVAELEKQSKECEYELMGEYFKSDNLKGQYFVFINDVRKFILTSKAVTRHMFKVYDAYVHNVSSELKVQTNDYNSLRDTLLERFHNETYSFEKFINDAMDQFKTLHNRRLTRLAKKKEYIKDEILFLLKKKSSLENKIGAFQSSVMKVFSYLDQMRVESRVLKTKNRALQLWLDAVETQAKMKDKLMVNINKGLKSDVQEQMEKMERLEHLKFVLRPQLDAELKKCRDTEAKLHCELLTVRSKIVSAGLSIEAVEKKIDELLKKNSERYVTDKQVKKYLEGVKSDLNEANQISDNRVQLRKTLMLLYRKYINNRATDDVVYEVCNDQGVPATTKKGPGYVKQKDVDKSGLNDVVEFYEMEGMLKKGEQLIQSEIKAIRKQLPDRPHLIVGHKVKYNSSYVTIIKEINSYRQKIMRALENLVSEQQGKPCECQKI